LYFCSQFEPFGLSRSVFLIVLCPDVIGIDVLFMLLDFVRVEPGVLLLGMVVPELVPEFVFAG